LRPASEADTMSPILMRAVHPTNPRSRPRGLFIAVVGFLLTFGAWAGWTMALRMSCETAPDGSPEASSVQKPADSPALPNPPGLKKPDPVESVAQEENNATQAALEEENRQLREQLVGLFNWILTNFRGQIPLPEAMVSRLNLPAVTEEGVLHPDLEAFLRISSEQRVEINQALNTARAAMDFLRQDALKIDFPDERSLVAVLAPFPEKGGDVRARLYADLDAVLGTYRFGKMQESAGEGLANAFDQFGRSERRIEVEVVGAPAGGEEYLRMRDEVRLPEADGSIRISAREFSARDLPLEYQFLLSAPPSPESGP